MTLVVVKLPLSSSEESLSFGGIMGAVLAGVTGSRLCVKFEHEGSI